LVARAPIDRGAADSRHNFYPTLAAQLLTHHGSRLDPQQRDRRIDVMQHATEQGLQNARLTGYNDNRLLLGVSGLLSGDTLHPLDPAVADIPADALQRLFEMLDPQGFMSEYTLPTYSPISMLCAELVEHCPFDEAHELTVQCERRLWVEVATHWHPATCFLARPRSRAY
jgi:hypothetical protein